jgi:hypothetical protein
MDNEIKYHPSLVHSTIYIDLRLFVAIATKIGGGITKYVCEHDGIRDDCLGISRYSPNENPQSLFIEWHKAVCELMNHLADSFLEKELENIKTKSGYKDLYNNKSDLYEASNCGKKLSTHCTVFRSGHLTPNHGCFFEDPITPKLREDKWISNSGQEIKICIRQFTNNKGALDSVVSEHGLIDRFCLILARYYSLLNDEDPYYIKVKSEARKILGII